ncbi:MAG: hypothetical protein IT376_04395 [Polyangiaceae bacterium]|nr:hypothetical protein [Polyangiaceae bacterium]
MKRRWIWLAAAGGLQLGCSALVDYPESRSEVGGACRNGVDDDFDGYVDCADGDCAESCREDDAERCANGLDDDQDDLADCADPACRSFCLENDATRCRNGADDDGNGKADCADPACFEVCREDDAERCHNGTDDDSDGLADCRDPDCAAHCPEADAATCANSLDDDHDGRVDCDDDDCDGFCPEESSDACANGRDDDGDGVIDGSDPRCWLLAPPEVARCASYGAQELVESFDTAMLLSDPWYTFGGLDSFPDTSDQEGRLDLGSPWFEAPTTSPGYGPWRGMGSRRVLSGLLDTLRLELAARVVDGARVRVALVPAAGTPDGQAPPEDPAQALLTVDLDAQARPPRLSLALGAAGLSAVVPLPLDAAAPCAVGGTVTCAGGWYDLTVARDGDDLVARVSGAGVAEARVTVGDRRLPIDAARLTVSGSGALVQSGATAGQHVAQVDDLRVVFEAVDPCGAPVPQVPAAALACSATGADHGHSLALAQDGSALCALIPEGPADALPVRVMPWVSPDGSSWGPAGPGAVFPETAGRSIVGVGIAHDGSQLRAAAVVRSSSVARLFVSAAGTCVDTWSAPSQVALLPFDAEAPSWITGLPNAPHAIYFTRPPTDEAQRTLWRATSADGATFTLEDRPVAEFAAEWRVASPLALSRVGARDVVAAYRLIEPGEPSAAGLLVATDPTLGAFGRVGAGALLAPGGGTTTFDGDDITAAALAWSGSAGTLLYSARSVGAADGSAATRPLRTGTARLAPAGEGLPLLSTPAPRCGDGACDADESCASCAGDCPCASVRLTDRFEDAAPWSAVTLASATTPAGALLYVDGPAGVARFASGDSTWLHRPLGRQLTGDFRLSFDLFGARDRFSGCKAVSVGLGRTPTPTSPAPDGLFARWVRDSSCFESETGAAVASIAGGVLTESFVPSYTGCTGYVPTRADDRLHVTLVREGTTARVDVSGEDGCAPAALGAAELTLPASPVLGDALLIGHGATWNATTSEWDSECAVGTVGWVDNLVLQCDPADCACQPGLTECGAVCTDTDTDVRNCGACGNVCGPGRSCVAGSCLCPVADCTGVCKDIYHDEDACGGCGNVCGPALECRVGGCGGAETCAAGRTIPPAGGTFTFTMTDTASHHPPPCTYLGDAGGDLAFRWTPSASGTATVRFGAPTVDVVVAAGSSAACDATSLSANCADDYAAGFETISFSVTAGATYYIVGALWGASSNPTDPVTLEVGVQ